MGVLYLATISGQISGFLFVHLCCVYVVLKLTVVKEACPNSESLWNKNTQMEHSTLAMFAQASSSLLLSIGTAHGSFNWQGPLPIALEESGQSVDGA